MDVCAHSGFKRPRVQAAQVDVTPFTCDLRKEASGFSFSVHLPSELISGSPVLAELASSEGAAAIKHDPDHLLAWLAWHASRPKRAQHAAAGLWDAEADAFKVHSRASNSISSRMLPARTRRVAATGCLLCWRVLTLAFAVGNIL